MKRLRGDAEADDEALQYLRCVSDMFSSNTPLPQLLARMVPLQRPRTPAIAPEASSGFNVPASLLPYFVEVVCR